ncbi:MAG: MFS transporter [Burkholderiales bacterium]
MLYLIVGLNIIVHGAFLGSRLIVSLYALQEFKATPLEVGMMVALYTVPPWLLGVYAGRVNDRYGARKPMLFGSALVGIGLLVPYFWRSLPALYVLAVLLGTGFVFYNAANQNLAGAFGPREDRAKNFSTMALGYSLSSLVGPLAGGYSIDYLSPAIAFLIFACMLLIPFTVLWRFRGLTASVSARTETRSSSTFDLLRMPELRRTLILGALVVTGWDLYLFYLPIYGNSIGMTGALIGKVMAVFAVGTFVVRFAMPWLVKRFTARYTLAAFVVFGAVMLVTVPFVTNVWFLGGVSFLLGLALGCGQPLTLMLAYNRSPAGRTGEVTGIRLTLNHGMHSVVPLIAGAIGSAFGAIPPFLMTALILGSSGYLATKVTPTAQVIPPEDKPPR